MQVYSSWHPDDRRLCMTVIIPAESWDVMGFKPNFDVVANVDNWALKMRI